MYRQKTVEKIALIKAVVDIESENEAKLLWKNVSEKTAQLIKDAQEKVSNLRPGEYPTRVFLLENLHDTDFKKDSPGGMLGSKQYFDIARAKMSSAEDLAKYLNGRQWSEWN
jgi:hypothetical protein